MSESLAQDREKISAALLQIAGEYRVASGVRNMLLIIAATVVPLLVLIVIRLLNHFVPPSLSLAVGGLIAMGLFGPMADFIFGAVRIDANGVERHSPWFWLNWRVERGDIAALGSVHARGGRHLVIKTVTDRFYRLPFRPGFERLLAVIG